MSEPRRLTTLWAFTACYRDNFFLLPYTQYTVKLYICSTSLNHAQRINVINFSHLYLDRSTAILKGSSSVYFWSWEFFSSLLLMNPPHSYQLLQNCTFFDQLKSFPHFWCSQGFLLNSNLNLMKPFHTLTVCFFRLVRILSFHLHPDLPSCHLVQLLRLILCPFLTSRSTLPISLP
jgi:hypothetical protein